MSSMIGRAVIVFIKNRGHVILIENILEFEGKHTFDESKQISKHPAHHKNEH